ncbi:MAG: hypothetical protein IJW86_10260 [Clostridia bacterium]|nr:hypothetical protein [Clostridia bacterium]
MKKTVSLILTVLMFFSIMAPVANAYVDYEALPVIYIRGNGETIYDEDGNEVTVDLDGLFADDGEEGEDGEEGKNKIIEACANILLPFLTEGLIMDKWDNYGKAIYEELSPLFEKSHLDGNGDPKYGTCVSKTALAQSEAEAKKNKGTDNWYNFNDFAFCYDWRLSPYDHVERLHEYVETVRANNGNKQVCLVARCFGGSLLTAYLEQYGHLGHVKKAVFSDVLSGGCTIVSKSFSGKIAFDDNSVQRYVRQLEQCGELGVGQGFVLTQLTSEIVNRTVDLFKQTTVLDSITGGIEGLYDKLYQALIPAICFASGIATQPNYWTCVYEEDFDQAFNLIFGEEGSEARTEYAGLIEKVVTYRERVTADIDGLMLKFRDEYGIHIGIIGKYGYMNAPFTEGEKEPSDALVSLKDSTFGATCADVGKKLTDSYINSRIAENAENAKYISPDKQVDLSTCLFPETTWIIKNIHHDYGGICEQITMDFFRSKKLTVDAGGAFPQFIMFDEKTETWRPMTEDDCADYEWLSTPVEEPTTESRIVSLMRWLTTIFNLISMLIKGEISFNAFKEAI